MKAFNICLIVLLALLPLAVQAQTRIDPKNPDWQYFPAIDTMRGVLHRIEQFGREIHAAGDVNNDGIMDFTINHLRTDTSFTVNSDPPYQVSPDELLLFHGVKGKMPPDSSGERIGPTEISADVRFLAAGDFDHDDRIDIAAEIVRYQDTIRGGGQVGTVVIFWQDSAHHFSINDTSRLSSGAQGWSTVISGIAYDADGDGATDLLLYCDGWGVTLGHGVPVPPLMIYQGHKGERWGYNGRARTPDWHWWSPTGFNTLGPVIDQDADGNLDVPLYLNQDGSAYDARVSVLYGRHGNLPDTNDVETLVPKSINGRTALFSDVTQDAIPELIMMAGNDGTLNIYAGRRGQRLLEQYGTGNDDPQPGKGWWRRPWAVLWSAYRLDDGWNPGGFSGIFDMHDGNLDGINDIWEVSPPYLLCYVTGDRLDSLIDGIVELPEAGPWEWLGDIDSSGVPTFAIYSNPLKATVLYKATKALPSSGVYRQLPNELSSVEEPAERRKGEAATLQLQAVPNPAHGEVRIRWRSQQLSNEATVTIRDVLGREVAHWNVPARQDQTSWKTENMVGGAYFITLTIGTQHDTTRIVVR